LITCKKTSAEFRLATEVTSQSNNPTMACPLMSQLWQLLEVWSLHSRRLISGHRDVGYCRWSFGLRRRFNETISMQQRRMLSVSLRHLSWIPSLMTQTGSCRVHPIPSSASLYTLWTMIASTNRKTSST